MKAYFRLFRQYLKKVLHSKSSNHEIAFGFTLGVLTGILAPYGLHIVIGVFLAWLFRVNKIASAIGTFVNTPVTAVPFYVFAWKLGTLVHGKEDTLAKQAPLNDNKGFLAFIENIWYAGPEIILHLYLGLFVIALVSALPSYYLTRFWVSWVRARLPHRRQAQN